MERHGRVKSGGGKGRGYIEWERVNEGRGGYGKGGGGKLHPSPSQ
jgi:hypothetical protein